MISTVTLSSKNQITIPKLILDLYSIKSGEKLFVETEADAIRVKPMGKSIIDEIAGSVKVEAGKKGVPYKKALSVTIEKVVKELAHK